MSVNVLVQGLGPSRRVGKPLSEECREFLNQLAKAKARREGSPGVTAQMGVSLGLQRGQSFCPLSAGAQERRGFRWRHSAHH